MEQLREILDSYKNKLNATHQEELIQSLENLASVYPFNEFEYQFSNFLGFGAMTRDEYLVIRNEYIGRNLFLPIFEIAGPRTFGENWAQGQLKSIVSELEKPTKKVDINYSGEYDFYLSENDKFIKIEVKASRAVDADSRESLAHKALSFSSPHKFTMNFQQVKIYCADVFVFIAVWRDEIRYWVFNSKELEALPEFQTSQHRGNTGEGQIHFKNSNIHKFEGFLVTAAELKSAIMAAYERLNP